MSVPILPLNEMSVEEKLQTMEALWQSLSADPAAIESPAWHEEELAERERKIESGEAKFVEWEKAKADIRRRTFVRPVDLAFLREAVTQRRIQWRRHVLEKLAERGIQQQAVREVLLEGEKIRDYTQDRPFPSALFLGYIGGKPLHAVAACDEISRGGICDHCLRAIVRSF